MVDVWNIKTNNGDKDFLDNIIKFVKNKDDIFNTIYNNFNNYKESSNMFIENNNIVIKALTEFEKKIIITKPYLLNLTKNIFDPIEKYVYDIFKFHINRLNMPIDKNYSVEFWISDEFNNNRDLHFDWYEFNETNIENVITPFLSTLTYFNNSNIPTIITNIDNNHSNGDNKNIYLSFPKSCKHIAFHGGKYLHGTCNILDKQYLIKKKERQPRYSLNIFIYDSILKFTPYYYPVTKSVLVFKKDDPLILFEENNKTKNIKLEDKCILEILFNKIINEKINYDSFYPLKPIIENELINTDTFYIND
jgi:hypothetical protein